MKKKDFNDWKTKNRAEINKRVAQLEKEKVETMVRANIGKAKNVHSVRQMRIDIAQLKTLGHEKDLVEKLENKKLKKEKTNGTN
jgi:ribosomal protein L29